MPSLTFPHTTPISRSGNNRTTDLHLPRTQLAGGEEGGQEEKVEVEVGRGDVFHELGIEGWGRTGLIGIVRNAH